VEVRSSDLTTSGFGHRLRIRMSIPLSPLDFEPISHSSILALIQAAFSVEHIIVSAEASCHPFIFVCAISMSQPHVGICGAGLGGLAAAIAISKAGAKVTVLEAAAELGEIGAGIQMSPNVARLLIKWGVGKVIGDNLVEFEELNMRRKDGTKIGYTKTVPDVRKYDLPLQKLL